MTTRYLNPTNDVAFKKLFGTENHKPLLISFLNAVLNLEGSHKIKEIEFLPQEQIPLIKEGKSTILDVKCTNENNVQYVVEMQNQSIPEFLKRTQFYAAHSYVSQADKGSSYLDLKPVVLLTIANYILFPSKEDVISYHKTLDEKTNEHDLNEISYAFIELEKFKKTEKDLASLQDKWVYFFKNWKNSKDIPFTVKEKELIEAYHSMEEFNWTKGEREAYFNADLAHTDEVSARQKKWEEGHKEGEKKKSLQIAQSMLKENLPIDQISKFTGLSVEEIKSLQK